MAHRPRKAFFETSEFWALVAAATAVVLAAAFADNFNSPLGWTAFTVLAGGYMLSRGAAKARRGAARPAPRRATPPLSAPTAGAEARPAKAVTLSEERLYVDKQERPRERVRLRKHIVTEEVTITVPVRREEVRIEREPIGAEETGPPRPDAPGEELTLMAEEPIVEKRVVPRERVWLEKDVHLEDRDLSESLRREELDVERERYDEPGPGGQD